MVIKSVETDPEYRDVLEACIREVGEALGDTVPEFSNLRSFVLCPPRRSYAFSH